MMITAVEIALEKGGVAKDAVDVFVAGDLLNQIIISGYSALKVGALHWASMAPVPAFARGCSWAGCWLTAAVPNTWLPPPPATTARRSASFAIPPNTAPNCPRVAQHTVTGAAAVWWPPGGSGPVLELATVGKVMDLGIKDPYNMGAAMAPAASRHHFHPFGRYRTPTRRL